MGNKHLRKGYTSKRYWGQDFDIKQEFLNALQRESRLFSDQSYRSG